MTQHLYKAVIPDKRLVNKKVVCYSTVSQEMADKGARTIFHLALPDEPVPEPRHE